MTTATAAAPGVSRRNGTAPMGAHIRCAPSRAGTPIAFRARKRSTASTAGSCATCVTNGSAASMPTCRLFAPSASANAAMNPPLATLNTPPDANPSHTIM